MIFKTIKNSLIISIFSATLVGCAAPATRNIELSKDELRHEQAQHREIAGNSKQRHLRAKHSDLNFYRSRLNKVAPRLMQAASSVCKKDCNYTFKVVNSNDLNAWADGRTVNITPVMMDFLATDQELALILSHELAHNIMGHIGKKQQNVIVGALVDIVAAANGIDTGGTFTQIGGMSYSQGFENEADYVAIYIMAKAGYNIDNAHLIWRKMSQHLPQGVHASFFSSHPSNPERFLRMQKAIAEVKQKIAKGEKLEPNYK